jgi:hypothetical protein
VIRRGRRRRSGSKLVWDRLAAVFAVVVLGWPWVVFGLARLFGW